MNDELEIKNNVDGLDLQSNQQDSFLQTTLGRVINLAVDTGLRAILPDVVENEVIDIKDTFLNEGFSEGINKAIKTASDIGKSIMGIFTGTFESISQAEKAIEKGGLIDGVSEVIDDVVDKVDQTNIVPSGILNVVKEGKDILLNNVSEDIKKEFVSQDKSIERLEKYSNRWREEFNNQNLEGMEKYIKKIKNTLEKILPLESLISEARQIENLHELIKNNGGDFNLSEEQMELANVL